jgi:hypothetical protein
MKPAVSSRSMAEATKHGKRLPTPCASRRSWLQQSKCFYRDSPARLRDDAEQVPCGESYLL